jgi:hypothetical protein
MQTHGIQRFARTLARWPRISLEQPRLGRRLLAPLAALVLGAMVVAPPSAAADQRDFSLINESRTTITRVYVSPSSSDRWGADWLGSEVLRPGQTARLNFSAQVNSGTCLYDVKLVRSDGGDVVRTNVDLCRTTSLTYR